jgi:hypothetical protein
MITFFPEKTNISANKKSFYRLNSIKTSLKTKLPLKNYFFDFPVIKDNKT